jgi:hypothetical protein
MPAAASFGRFDNVWYTAGASDEWDTSASSLATIAGVTLILVAAASWEQFIGDTIMVRHGKRRQSA